MTQMEEPSFLTTTAYPGGQLPFSVGPDGVQWVPYMAAILTAGSMYVFGTVPGEHLINLLSVSIGALLLTGSWAEANAAKKMNLNISIKWRSCSFIYHRSAQLRNLLV